ncbi:MAG TPA: glycosyltransferase [Microlunatus sp.]|nr:glycosyltransferase [Microlunatus sp.]
MKITFVSEHASPLAAIGGVDAGGQNVHVAELAKALSARGHDVVVVTRRDSPTLPDRVSVADGYTVAHLDAGPASELPKDDLWPHMPQFADGLRDVLATDPPNLVHGHFWMSTWAARQAARGHDLPVLATFHALGSVKRRHQRDADTSPEDRRDVEARLVADVDHIVATCADEVSELHALTPDPAPISVVPCGVDVDHFTPEGPRDDDRILPHRIVALGRLVPRKGFGTIVEALGRLPDTELVLAGGTPGPDPERDRLLDLAARLGVTDRLRWRPQVPRSAVPALLRSADLVVTVPWYEPFGIVPLEAMACGRPVVASAVGGMLDTVLPGRTGLHVPPRRPDALAEAVRQLLDDPTRRAAYGRAGAARARSRYSWTRVADGTERAYRSALRARRSPAPLTAVGA